MTAAILQGVPATTFDTDLWIDLPEGSYIRILRLCQKLGATILANTVVELTDGSMVNFHYHADGLLRFGRTTKGYRSFAVVETNDETKGRARQVKR
jgi:hypothetical protein